MAAIAKPSSSPSRSSPPGITVTVASSHHLETGPRRGTLKIQIQIWKSYLGFRHRSFSDELSFPLSVLTDPSLTLLDFMKVFDSAKLAQNLWNYTLDLIFTRGRESHVPDTRQQLGLAVNIEVPADIHELRRFEVSGEGNLLIGECSICYEELCSGGEVTEKEGCLHVFHSSCLRKWLEDKDSCPLCRRVIIR